MKTCIKRIGSLTLASMLSISILAACSGQDSGSGKTPEANSGKIERIQMWGSWGGDQVAQIETQIQSFNSQNPDYVVEYDVQDSMEEKLITAHSSGDVPDAVLWDRFHTSVYAPKGAFTDIGSLVERDGIDLDDFYAPAVDELTYDNILYGLPMTVDTRIIFYNKDMFQAAGVDPSSIRDWDSLRTAAEALTIRDEKGVLVQAGFSFHDVGLFNNWIKQAGGTMIDDSSNPAVTAFNTEAGLKVLEYYDQMLNQSNVYDWGFHETYGEDAFKAETAAMTFNGPWVLETYRSENLNFGVIAQPEGPNGDKAAMMGGFGLVIPAKTKNLEGGWEFIKWWTCEVQNGLDFAKITGNLPGNRKAAEDPYFADDEVLSVFTGVLEYAGIRSKVPGYSDMESMALIPELQKYVNGEVSAQEALEKAQSSGDKILAEAAEK